MAISEESEGNGNILLIATTRLCKDGLTEIVLRIAKTACMTEQIGIALPEGCDAAVEAELRKYGHLYFLPSRKKKLPMYLLSLLKLVAQENYETVHIHGNSATMALDLAAAWLGGAKNRITHTHNCAKQPYLKQKTLGTVLNWLVTCPVACSEAAGKMLYTKSFTILTNGVDCERFAFSPQIRAAVRKELGVGDAYVIGHIGRFSQQKNQLRLLHIFSVLLKIHPNAVLLLCGEGEELEKCRQAANSLNIHEKVIFPGKVEQPQNYYQAMDVFVLPSLFEGLPLVGVEAQASGLPCVFSNAITKETGILPECVFLPLEAPDASWADAIVNSRVAERASAAELVAKAGYTEQALQEQIRELYSRAK